MPVVWMIDAYRAGERGQVRALVDGLADALGDAHGGPCETLSGETPPYETVPYETKVLAYRKAVFWPHLFGGASIAGITAESAAQLTGPWPDLVVSCGVRNEPVCRWIQQQSGGRTRYVHVGKPWGSLDSFDLIVTTPQYRVPDRPNVVNNLLTLHSLNADSLTQAKEEWREAFSALPGPYYAVIVGGDSGPFTLGPKSAARLGREASQLAQANGGSLLVTTSSRTRASAVDALRDAITVPNYFYPWEAGATSNPYKGILAWADQLIVSADSIAMLSEACGTGKPVKMFDLGGMREDRDVPARDFRLSGSLYALLLRWFWQPASRDVTLVHKRLREAGYAFWTDEFFANARVPAQSGLERAVTAVRELLRES